MAAVNLLNLSIDVTQIFLLVTEEFLGFFRHQSDQPIEIGRITSAISVISGEILSIMIRTPTSVATDVMIVVMLWFSP